MPAVQSDKMQPRILFVEDEPSISDPFSKALVRAGFEPVDGAHRPRGARARGAASSPTSSCSTSTCPTRTAATWRASCAVDGDVPIVMLTARGTEMDRIVGLELGADDYVVKPFSGAEVIARIRAVLRRARRAAPATPASPVHGRRARPSTSAARRATLDGSELELSRKEFDLLAELVAQRRHGRHRARS